MPLALFQTKLSNSSVDREKGVIYGVRVMELGRLACFAGPNGEVKRVKITPRHIEALLSHAGNRAIPMHLTHEWTNAIGTPTEESTEMAARIGALKSFRRDEEGNLIADAYLKNGPIREDLFFAAEHNPEDNMLSAVFKYQKDDPECLPTNFRAADLVPEGAATTALFSNFKPTNETMDKTAFLAMLKDPDVIAAFSALIPKHNPEEAQAELKKAIDEGVTAALANHKPKLSEEEETALLKKAEASFTKSIGANPGLRDFVDKSKASDEFENAVQAQLSAGAKDRAVAIWRVAQDKPELYNAHMKKING